MPDTPARGDSHPPIRVGRRHYRTWDCEMRKAEPDGSYFEGHCAVLHSIDEYGTIMGRDRGGGRR